MGGGAALDATDATGLGGGEPCALLWLVLVAIDVFASAEGGALGAAGTATADGALGIADAEGADGIALGMIDVSVGAATRPAATGGAAGLRRTTMLAPASAATSPTATTAILTPAPFGFWVTSVSLPVVPPAPHDAFVAATAVGRWGGCDANIVGNAPIGVPRTRETRSAVFR